MNRYYHNGNIKRLGPNEIFVFGSNMSGVHGAGAALFAKQHFKAEQGIGIGPTGRCYALPTKDHHIQTLDLKAISAYVDDLLIYAATQPQHSFLLTAVGCGLAGYKPKQIAPLFKDALENMIFPPEFMS